MGRCRVRAGAGVAVGSDPRGAGARAAGAAAEGLAGAPADIAVVFASGALVGDSSALLEGVHEALAPRSLIGCGAGGVLGEGEELESGSAVAVWAAALDGDGSLSTFSCTDSAANAVAPAGGGADGASGVILLADPHSFPVEAALAELARIAPALPLLGGVASARRPDGTAALYLDEAVCEAGAVGLLLDGVELLPCVSQGAAPLGREATITRAEGNLIIELAGRPALETLERLIAELSARERGLLAGGLLLGIVIDPGKPEFEQGDFLVRGVLGADRASGAVAVAAEVRAGQIVQLHARDARSADEDLRRALRLRREALGGPPAGALVFSCNGRGSAMWGVAGHDAEAVQREFGGAPSAGFFAAGEIGPVAGRSFLHSFTATIAVFPG